MHNAVTYGIGTGASMLHSLLPVTLSMWPASIPSAEKMSEKAKAMSWCCGFSDIMGCRLQGRGIFKKINKVDSEATVFFTTT